MANDIVGVYKSNLLDANYTGEKGVVKYTADAYRQSYDTLTKNEKMMMMMMAFQLSPESKKQTKYTYITK